MKYFIKDYGLEMRYKILTFLLLIATNSSLCQQQSERIFNSIPAPNQKSHTAVKKNKVAMEITASVLPGAKITRLAGNYTLRSHPQSSYDAGIKYIHDINESISVSSGLHMAIGFRNFFANLPDNAIPGYPSDPPVIEDKELWTTFKLPLMVEKRIKNKTFKTLSLKAGLSFQYTGFMQDETIDGFIIDSNKQTIHIFNAELSVRNNNKPWVTLMAGVSKPFTLDNKNILCIGLLANISTTDFYRGSYIITIPNQPKTSGTYKINGTALGLSVQYIFTGTNKRLVRNYQKKFS